MIYFKHWKIPWTWKGVEFQIDATDSSDTDRIKLYRIDIIRRKQMDHAGTELEIRGPERTYMLKFYDSRHWNREEERWKQYEWDEEKKEYIPENC